MALINFPILYINDPTKGRPVFNGQVFVGEPDLDPEVVINQKQLNVIQENGDVVPVAQPFILSAGGVPVYNGSPVQLDVDGKFSLKILNKLGTQVYYVSEINPFNDEFSVTKTAITVVPGQTIYPLPSNVSAEAVVIVDNNILMQTAGAYSFDASNNLVLSEGLFENQVLEVWYRAIAVPASPASGGILTFDTVALALASTDIAEGDLIDIKELVTDDPLMTYWDVVLASSLPVGTPDIWNPRVATVQTNLAISLRGADDWPRKLSDRPIEFIAHRGGLSGAPENTALAMSLALNKKFDSLEMDVQPSSDGTFWCFHDPDLAPDTNLTGAISNTTDAVIETALTALNVGTRFAGMGLSKFEDVLKIASKRRVKIYPEMKFTGWTNANIDAFLQLLDDNNYLNDQCMIQAVDFSLLQYIRTQNKDVLVAWANQLLLPDAKANIDLLGAMYNGAIIWDHNRMLNNPNFFSYCFDRGVKIVAFTPFDVDKVMRLKELGCYQIIADTYLGENL